MSSHVPTAAPIPEIPRSTRDDGYERSHPLPPKRAGVGVVVSVQTGTVTVLINDEEVTGCIPLTATPPVGTIVEVESRGDLAVVLEWAEVAAPVDLLRISRPGNSVYVEGTGYVYTSPVDWPTGDNQPETYLVPIIYGDEAHGSYGTTFVVESMAPDPVLLIGSETVETLEDVVQQRVGVTYSSLYPVTLEVSGGDSGSYLFSGPAGDIVTVLAPWTSDPYKFIAYGVLFATAFEAEPTYSVPVWEWWIESQVQPPAPVEAVTAMAAAEGGSEPSERWLIVPGEWVQRYAGDGTQSAAGGVAQGVLDRDDLDVPDEDGSGNEASLVGFDVELPSDAQVTQVRLQTQWESWSYPTGVGSLVVGWHTHATAPDQWSVGDGAAELSEHDVWADRLVNLPLGWAAAVVGRDDFGGIVIGPGRNTSPLYGGSTDVAPTRWTLAISFLSAEGGA